MKISLACILLLTGGLIAVPAAPAAMLFPRGEANQSPIPSDSAVPQKEQNASIAGGKPDASRSSVMEMAKKKKATKKKATSRAS